jgi:hypothetical protein
LARAAAGAPAGGLPADVRKDDAMSEKSGLGGLFDKARDLVTDERNIRQAKELATDKNVDTAAEHLKRVAPDRVDGLVDKAAAQAKKHNDR